MKFCLQSLAIFCTCMSFISSANPHLESCKTAVKTTPTKATVLCLNVLQNNERDFNADEKTELYLEVAMIAMLDGNFTLADKYMHEAEQGNATVAEATPLRHGLLRRKGVIEFKQDNFEQAARFFEDALATAKSLQSDTKIGMSLNDLGAVYMELGDFSKSLDYFERGLVYQDKAQRFKTKSYTLSNIGIIYRELAQYDLSISYFSRALSLLQEELSKYPDDKILLRQLPQQYESRGITYLKAKRYEDAKSDLNLALDLYIENEFYPPQVRVNAALSDLYVETMQYNLAEEAIERALALEKENGWRYLELILAQVNYHISRRNLDVAITFALEGRQQADEKKRFEYQLSFYKKLGELFKLKNEFSISLSYLNQYIELYQRYLEQKFDPQVTDLQSVIEVQQQQKEIQLLEFENQAVAARNKQQRLVLFFAASLISLLIAFIVLLVNKKRREEGYLRREIKFHQAELARALKHDTDTSTEVEDSSTFARENTDGTEIETDNGISVFHQRLVSLMCDCVDIWGNVTGKTNIELAEESKLWSVVIDDGRLRTRTLEKYLHIDRLPKVPRWRNVVSTCRFILINCDLSTAQRNKLNDELEHILELQKAKATFSNST